MSNLILVQDISCVQQQYLTCPAVLHSIILGITNRLQKSKVFKEPM